MSRKTFYYILAIILSLIVIDFVTAVYFRKNSGISFHSIAHIKDLVALFIILYQTAQARKTIRILNYILLPAGAIGLLFLIQHWPLGRVLFFIPGIVIVIGLYADTFKNRAERLTTSFILFFPAFHLLYIYFAINYFAGALAVLSYFVMGIIALAVIIRLLSQNERPII